MHILLLLFAFFLYLETGNTLPARDDADSEREFVVEQSPDDSTRGPLCCGGDPPPPPPPPPGE